MRRSRRPTVRWPPRRWSLRRRLVMLLLIRLAVALTMIAAGTWWVLTTTLQHRLNSQLNSLGQVIENYVNHDGEGALASFAGPVPNAIFGQLGDTGAFPDYLMIWDRRSGRVIRIGNAPITISDPASHVSGGGDGATSFDISDGEHGQSYRVRVARLPHGLGYVALAVSERDLTQLDREIGQVELVSWLVAFVTVGFFANRRIRRELRPLADITDSAYAIGAGDLSTRVEPEDTGTEVGRLAIALNSMLGRLESAFDERRASEDRLRRFVADASHELRTPLTSIRGYAELFRRGAWQHPADLATAMRRIESEAGRMGTLVDELLLLARLDSGRPLERNPVDVAALVLEVAADARAAGPHWPVTVHVPAELVALGDRDRLRQVLVNLLANVRAHTPPGTSATVTAEPRGEEVVIEVADDGPGMTPEQQAHVFERFYRADAARSRGEGAGGAGLGLSIVASVVAAHGGSAAVRSAPGEGTVFTVRLPACLSGDSQPGPSEPAAGDASLGRDINAP